MDLWIRSQNKKQLELVERVSIVHKTEKRSIIDDIEIKEECYIFVNGKDFGEYKNEQRAIEVLDEIQNELLSSTRYMVKPNSVIIEEFKNEIVVYQMPADDEVK